MAVSPRELYQCVDPHYIEFLQAIAERVADAHEDARKNKPG